MTIKKILITGLIALVSSVSIFLTFNPVFADNINNEQDSVIEPFENTMRPYKYWISFSRPYGGVTIQYSEFSTNYGAVYSGTLSLKAGNYQSGVVIYQGYLYNTNNNYRPLREELKE